MVFPRTVGSSMVPSKKQSRIPPPPYAVLPKMTFSSMAGLRPVRGRRSGSKLAAVARSGEPRPRLEPGSQKKIPPPYPSVVLFEITFPTITGVQFLLMMPPP